jgi:NitT/TauT family transport system permease protein
MTIKKNILLGPALLILCWLIVSQLELIESFFLPSPIDTFLEVFSLFTSGKILSDLAFTVGRVIFSFSLAIAIGLPIGLILGASQKIYYSFEFVIDFCRSVPATALFPLFLLVFGIGDQSKIAVTAIACSLVILFNTAHGVMNAKKARVIAAKLMGAKNHQVFRFISFWESLPQSFVGIRTALSYSLIMIIITEMFIGTSFGLGKRIIDAQYIYNIREMYAVIFISGIIGYLLNAAIASLEKRLIHWAGK